MPTQHQDGIGLLVVRAYVADAQPPTILVRVLEVGTSKADRVIGTATTPNEAGQIVARWLRALQTAGPDTASDPLVSEGALGGEPTEEPARDARVTPA